MRNARAVQHVQAWEALDSRGKPTVAARVTLGDGSTGTALVPSGASAGRHEAIELRDGERRYGGAGVRRAVENVHSRIRPAIVGLDGADPGLVDARLRELDTSPGYSAIGANALLAVSLAVWRAAADSAGTSLARYLAPEGPLEIPMPMINIVSGGAHAGGLVDVQDFLVIPHAADTFALSIEWAAAVRSAAREIALEQGYESAVLVADEGGLGLALPSNRAALELLTSAIELAGLRPGDDVSIAIDVAASELYRGGAYELHSERRRLDADALIAELEEWTRSFPVVSIEDPVAEDDWDGWAEATRRLGGSIELIGDDLFVTNPERLRRGIATASANSVLVKVNQNGIVSGAREVMDLARANGYRTVVSARSGETEDPWLADLAVGWRAGQIKVGSTHRSERTAKWNRLLELEATETTTFCGPWRDGAPRLQRSSTAASVITPL